MSNIKSAHQGTHDLWPCRDWSSSVSSLVFMTPHHPARRYVPSAREVEKLRDEEWWTATLAPFRGTAAASAAARMAAADALCGAPPAAQATHITPLLSCICCLGLH